MIITFLCRFLFEEWHKSVAVRASVLDPSYKRLLFIATVEKRDEVNDMVKEELRDQIIASNNDNAVNDGEQQLILDGELNDRDGADPSGLAFVEQFAGNQGNGGNQGNVHDPPRPERSDLDSKIQLAFSQYDMYLAIAHPRSQNLFLFPICSLI